MQKEGYNRGDIMKNFNLGRFILTILLSCNLAVLGCVGYLTYEQGGVISMLENKIDILALHQEDLIEELESIVLTTLKLQQESKNRIDYIEKSLPPFLKLIKAIIMEIGAIQDYQLILKNRTNNNKKDVEKLNKYKEKLKNKINSKKDIDLKNVKAIKEANVSIHNLTCGFMGAGTHIKIDEESYVLTCAHLIDGKIEDNILIIVSDFGTQSKAEIVKYNKRKDLMLLKVPQLKNTSYLEISDVAPKEGSEVMVIGNPVGIIDMITDGIITQINRTGYFIITNKVWFGNSGGSLLYKGKVVGVLSQILGYSNVSPFGIFSQNYGKCVGLEEIKAFLKEPNYEPK